MEYILSNYTPESLFRYFEDICSIPHGSGNEKQIADYLCNFAKINKLEYYRDSLNNVLIKKKATAGYEQHFAVLLQAHTDMVCEKNSDTLHHFEKDGLKLYEKDGWLYAHGTTLGADDGAGVAIMLAILSDKTLIHPALECLFTVQEETGMDGAIGFDYSRLTAKSLINLDSETLDTPIVSCSGGITSVIDFEFEKYKIQNNVIKISIKGLSGGHSGTDINSGRENANIIMGKLLNGLYNRHPFNLIAINGGNKANAIPRECVCIISVFDKKQAKSDISEIYLNIKKQLIKQDMKMTVRIEKPDTIPEYMFSYKDTYRIISAINLLPNGVISMSKAMPDLVETSSNIGIISTDENKIKFVIMPRSSVDSKLDEVVLKIDMLGKLLNAIVSHSERHPGWEYAKESKIRSIFSKCYEEKFGKKPSFEAIHAGLECGIICANMGELDSISICANVEEIHTPNERMNLKSFADAYEITSEMLKMM